MTGSTGSCEAKHAHSLAAGWALGSAVRRLSRRTGVTDAQAYGVAQLRAIGRRAEALATTPSTAAS